MNWLKNIDTNAIAAAASAASKNITQVAKQVGSAAIVLPPGTTSPVVGSNDSPQQRCDGSVAASPQQSSAHVKSDSVQSPDPQSAVEAGSDGTTSSSSPSFADSTTTEANAPTDNTNETKTPTIADDTAKSTDNSTQQQQQQAQALRASANATNNNRGSSNPTPQQRQNSPAAAAAAAPQSPQPQSNPIIEILKKKLEDTQNEIVQLRRSLQAREQQLTASQEQLHKLQSENAKAKRLVEDVNLEKAEAQKQLNELKDEFSKRLAAEEKKVDALRKERDNLKKNKTVDADIQKVITQKDEEIKQLMKEGEALAHRVSDYEQQIKKLNQAKKDIQAENEKLVRTVDSLSVELATVKSELEKRRNAQSEHSDIIMQYQQLSDATAKQLQERQAELEHTQRQLHASQQTIEQLRQELTAQAQRFDKEKAELLSKFERESNAKRKQHEETEQFWKDKVRQLEEEMVNMGDAAHRQEEKLRAELEDERRRCLAAERKNEQLVQSLPKTTAPLLHQIEMLENAAITKQEKWLQQENQYKEEAKKLRESVDRQQRINEKASRHLEEMKKRNAMLQEDVENMRAANAKITAELEQLREASQSRNKTVEAEMQQLQQQLQQRFDAELERVKKSEAMRVEQLETENRRLQQQIQDLMSTSNNTSNIAPLLSQQYSYDDLEVLGALSTSNQPLTEADLNANHNAATTDNNSSKRFDTSKLKIQIARIHELNNTTSETTDGVMILPDGMQKHAQHQHQHTTHPHQLHQQNSARSLSSLEGLGIDIPQSSIVDDDLGPSVSGAATPNRFYATPTSDSNHVILYQLQQTNAALIRQHEGEIASLLERLKQLDSAKEELKEELVALTTQNTFLTAENARLKSLEQSYAKLEQRYNAALELIGEKEEAILEMQQDMAEFKELYREQVNQLISKIEELSRRRG